MPKVLLLTGDAAEDLEVMYPYQRLLEEGYEVDVAAPTVKTLPFVVPDFVDGFDTYTEKTGHTGPADVACADVDPSEYVAVVVPGGRAPEYLRNDPDVRRILKHFFDAGAPWRRKRFEGRSLWEPAAPMCARESAVLAEAPIQQADRLAVQVTRAVHLYDDQGVAVALCGTHEGVARQVGEAGLADQRAGIPLQQLVLVDDLVRA